MPLLPVISLTKMLDTILNLTLEHCCFSSLNFSYNLELLFIGQN